MNLICLPDTCSDVTSLEGHVVRAVCLAGPMAAWDLLVLKMVHLSSRLLERSLPEVVHDAGGVLFLAHTDCKKHRPGFRVLTEAPECSAWGPFGVRVAC